ncbi:MAG: hypothetical protein ACI91B_004813, partial [Planctomycetota bacterium]
RQRVSKGGRYDLVPRGPATCAMVALDWLNVSNPSTRKPGSSITFEASRSSLWVYDVACKYVDEDHVHVAQAKRIRSIANTLTKNDANDAWWLAYLTYEGRLPEAYVPQGQILELRIATRERRSCVEGRTMIINRLRAHLTQLGEIVASSSVFTQKARPN